MDIQKFLDIRTHGFCRVAVVIPTVHVADPERNAEAHEALLQKAYDDGVFYAVCPELGLTGYTCDDLFHNETLQRGALAALERLVTWSQNRPNMLFSVGLPLVLDGMLFNVAATVMRGRVLAVAPKSYPPEYREFYELRHFARASEATTGSVALFGRSGIPFGNDVLIRSERNPDFVLHTEVCEDIWVPIPPGTKAALAGATVLANLSASNITIGKADYREQLVVGSSGKNVAVQMYSAAGFGESSSRASWDGDGYIAERGELLARTERFSMTGAMVVTDVNLRVLVLDRMRQSSFRQNAADNRSAFRTVRLREVGETRPRQERLMRFRREIDARPFVPSDPAKRDERCYETFNIQATALARRLLRMRPEMRRVFIGTSGGRDSTLALLVAARTMDLLGQPRTDIVCYSMPGPGTSEATRAVAEGLPKALGASFEEIPIGPLVEKMFGVLGFAPDDRKKDERLKAIYENVQALTRKHILFCQANQRGMVQGTGDLTELFIGWCTFAADQYSYYNPNGDVSKLLVSYLLAWCRDHVFTGEKDQAARREIDACLAEEISPELLPPDPVTGKISQKTEEIVGPYELHEFYGYNFVRFGRSVPAIARMALHAFGRRVNPLTGKPYDIADIKTWLREFLTRFFPAQAKRAAMPEGPKVGMVSVDPRGDWRMPSDIEPTLWLRELETEVPGAIAVEE